MAHDAFEDAGAPEAEGGAGQSPSSPRAGSPASKPQRITDSRLIVIETALGAEALKLRRLQGEEALSRLFRFELELVAEDPSVDFKQVVGRGVTVRIKLADATPRYFNGIISRIAQMAAEGGSADVQGRARALAVAAHAQRQLPHLPESLGPGHRREAVHRSRLQGLRQPPAAAVPGARVRASSTARPTSTSSRGCSRTRASGTSSSTRTAGTRSCCATRATSTTRRRARRRRGSRGRPTRTIGSSTSSPRSRSATSCGPAATRSARSTSRRRTPTSASTSRASTRRRPGPNPRSTTFPAATRSARTANRWCGCGSKRKKRRRCRSAAPARAAPFAPAIASSSPIIRARSSTRATRSRRSSIRCSSRSSGRRRRKTSPRTSIASPACRSTSRSARAA